MGVCIVCKAVNKKQQKKSDKKDMIDGESMKYKLEKADEKGMINGESMKYFLEKAQSSICKINLTKGFGSGFFCKIPYTEDNNHLIPVLITCNHVLSKDLIKKNNINIILNGQDKTISLNQRKIWTDEKIDFTCIEIKEKEDNIYTFFNLDDNIFTNEFYLTANVIIYGMQNSLVFSNGIIKNNKDGIILYTCNTYPGCSGGCIVNQFNNCVIGIHKGEIIESGNQNALNAGIFIREVIKYIKEHKNGLLLNVI
jgi:hypothetical protein